MKILVRFCDLAPPVDLILRIRILKENLLGILNIHAQYVFKKKGYDSKHIRSQLTLV